MNTILFTCKMNVISSHYTVITALTQCRVPAWMTPLQCPSHHYSTTILLSNKVHAFFLHSMQTTLLNLYYYLLDSIVSPST